MISSQPSKGSAYILVAKRQKKDLFESIQKGLFLSKVQKTIKVVFPLFYYVYVQQRYRKDWLHSNRYLI